MQIHIAFSGNQTDRTIGQAVRGADIFHCFTELFFESNNQLGDIGIIGGFRFIFFFSGVITVMTFTLTGLAVGLGALCPNFKEDNPSKIVSGFGGTLCLVLSFVYIVFSVATLAMGSTGWRCSRMRGRTPA